ncbi:MULTISPECIES: hypothetical protein [Rhodococcus]|uniref:Uncharacterized protein n=1 Tax=Rhodococcus oxybenzonivorans TaxID=1990687 RepID=A0AAE5A746_9NOCA|nr:MULTISPECIES: hypothetical protein [Rhodococcus]MDV7243458.1 hypothetical protein [Rhodococcus oxybenzonivorans]MDV7265164.1 hypothetical protein [Rhodococcus oxybenzonivorans]MDV7277434.1 hypothetical protein [Rhodococcus oxybenzonivorans]MDV7335538.1 hypothetical protein [Rhodococcus oxybenzonivorans]MDV7347146.1 hypothetical protein [Rhodococcus oxybenzonivorans]
MLEMLPWSLYVMAGCVLLLLMAPARAVLSESRARALERHHTARSRVVARRWQQAALVCWSACVILSAAMPLCLVLLAL